MKKNIVLFFIALISLLFLEVSFAQPVMNEIYSRGVAGNLDWIEIYNPSESPIDISGYKIYDIGGSSGSKTKKLFPTGTIMPAKGFYVIITDTIDFPGDLSGFGLSSGGEAVWLENASGTVIDTVVFLAMTTTQTYGRHPDGGIWQILNNITRGSSNNIFGNPTAFDLSIGSYSLTNWPASSSAGTYPSNMIFHRSGTQDPGLAVEMDANYTQAYNLTSGTRINGLDADGFSFVNTDTLGNLGAAVVAINTTGNINVRVSWVGGTVTATDGDRVYKIRLQYRIGASGTWTDVAGPVEYTSSTTGHSASFGPTTLPSEVNNKSVVQVRWKYYSFSSVSGGTRPILRVDEITISSTTVTSPTKLAVTLINDGVSPTANAPFSVIVQSQDNSNVPAMVTQNTNISISKATGTGTLGGTFTGTITEGTSSVTISGVNYNVAEPGVSITATRTSGDVLTSGTSSTFTVLEAATKLVLVDVPTTGQNNSVLPSFTVEARRSDDTKDDTYTGDITIAKLSGPGAISGTFIKAAIAGSITFDNIQFDQVGTYTISASASELTGATSGNINILDLTEVIIPQFIQGMASGTSNPTRVPFAYRVTLSGLIPSVTYRYINQVVTAADGPIVNGAGNCIFANVAGSFVRTSGPSLATTGNYGEFTSDASGNYTGWFVTEPTGNAARFTAGNTVYMRIMLNDGAGGTTVATRLTAATGILVKNFGTTLTEATGIRGYSFAIPSNFLILYDNESGTGRPISGALVEDDGSPNTTANSYVGFYADNVDGFDGRWGTLIPNTLANGVRRIEQRSLANGTIVNYTNDADGIWPGGSNTVNPSGGTSEIVLMSTEQYSVKNGWNMVSIPLVVNDPRKTIIFPTAISSAFLYNPGVGYTVKDTINNGKGYWLKFNGDQTIPFNGIPILNDSINVTTGWNMIGSVADSVAVSSIISVPENNVASSYYGYNNGYTPATKLYPAKAYWVKANQNGKLYLNSSVKNK